MDTIFLKGLTFTVEVAHDDSHGLPWNEHDGHGSVREASAYDSRNAGKTPGERVLHRARGRVWFYDWAAAMKTAKADGWGLGELGCEKLAAKLGRAPTPGEIRAAAVQADFDYCRDYLDDTWSWVGVVVTLLDTDGAPTDVRESLWGMESNDSAHLDNMARELAGEIARRIGRRSFVTKRVRVRK